MRCIEDYRDETVRRAIGSSWEKPKKNFFDILLYLVMGIAGFAATASIVILISVIMKLISN